MTINDWSALSQKWWFSLLASWASVLAPLAPSQNISCSMAFRPCLHNEPHHFVHVYEHERERERVNLSTHFPCTCKHHLPCCQDNVTSSAAEVFQTPRLVEYRHHCATIQESNHWVCCSLMLAAVLRHNFIPSLQNILSCVHIYFHTQMDKWIQGLPANQLCQAEVTNPFTYLPVHVYLNTIHTQD